MTGQIVIQGFSQQDKVPGFVAETVFGAGPISASSIPLVLLICGLKLTGWSTGLTPDVSIAPIFSAADADAAWGPGSEGARMAYKALKIQGITILGCAPTPGVSAAAATATITITGTATGVGTFSYRIAGDPITGGISSGDTPTVIALAIANAINAQPTMAVAASPSAGVVTLTWNSAGPRGNDGIIFQQTSFLAAGVSSAVAGGAALVSSAPGESGCRFHSGATAETLTALLATLTPKRYNRIAAAQYDATNLAAWVAQSNAKAGPLVGRTEQYVFGFNGTLSAVNSLASATLNDWRSQICWLLNSESHPSEIAAAMAALRVVKEQATPNSGYDGNTLLGIAAQASTADVAQRSTQQAALNSGVTPLVTDGQGKVNVVRAITTHCLNGSNPDFRTLDTAQSVVPDFVRDDLNLLWTTGYVVANPYVRDNPSAAEQDPPAGVGTPNGWNATVTTELKSLERQLIVTQVALNPPLSLYDNVAGRIESAVPVIPLPLQHQIGVSVRQLNAA